MMTKLAATSRKNQIIEMLIDSGADIQTRNKDDLNASKLR